MSDERTLGGYKLVSQLAVGGMAEIYVAKTAGVGGFEKLLALKLIHPNYSEDPDFVRMLVDEAKLAVQLQHANIVQTFDLGKVDNQYYIAMELIDGADLYKLLRRASEREIDFPFEVAAFIAQEVCHGLDYAHRKRDSKGRPLQIVHRDVSPQNVLVTFDGGVKIVDFGIAKAAMRRNQTAAGVIKGKYYYMSPEQAWGDPIDARTDVFSTGILLYEMLVGQMLYLEEDLDKLLDQVRKANIPPPSTKRKGVPEELQNIIMRALRKRAEERFQTAAEFGNALTQWLHSYAPDFNRTRVSAFVQEIIAEDPTGKTLARDARINTALSREQMTRDENSLLFKLADLAPPEPAPEPESITDTPQARRADEQTNPAPLEAMQGLRSPQRPATRVAQSNDFDENEATIVDPGGQSIMQRLEEDAARAAVARKLRELGPFDSDPGSDQFDATPTRTMGDIDTGSNPTAIARAPSPLPGVRSQPAAAAASPAAARPPSQKMRAVPPPPPLTALKSEGPGEDDATDLRRRMPPSSPPPAAIPTLPRETAAPPQSADPDDALFETLPRVPRSGSGTGQLPAVIPQQQQQSAADSGPVLPYPAPFDTVPVVNETATTPSIDDLRARSSAARNIFFLLTGIALAGATIAYFLLAPDGSRASMEVVSSPSGASVRLDGNAVSHVTPLEIPDVDSRQAHHVAVSLRGYDVWESDVRFEPGARQVRVQAVLVPIVGTLEIDSTPSGAEAIVNGRISGTTPTTVGDLPPNEDVTVELRLRGYKVAVKTVSWQGKRKLSINIPLEKAK